MLEKTTDDSSALMIAVEKIAITPEDARAKVEKYRSQFKASDENVQIEK